MDTLLQTRKELADELEKQLPSNYTYWQTEYCPMEQNPDNPRGGGGRDLGMNTALYVARVIHHDLTVANAASWQWWTAFSEWDYKDGLIFVDDGMLANGASRGDEKMIETCKQDGTFRTSKLLWVLGNYSFFVRPGMVRLGSRTEQEKAASVMSSAFADKKNKKLVVVLINYSDKPVPLEISFTHLPKEYVSDKFQIYETSSRCDLVYKGQIGSNMLLPARAVVTLVSAQ